MNDDRRHGLRLVKGGKETSQGEEEAGAAQQDSEPGQDEDGAKVPSFVDGLEYNDVGNAQRLVAEHGKDLAYVASMRQWLYWSEEDGIWKWDNDGRVIRLAISTLDLLKERARMLDTKDPDGAEQLRKFVSKSKAKPRLDAMVGLAQSMEGVSLTWGAFDSRPHQIGETRMYRNPGVAYRPARRQDYRTMQLGAGYDEAARSKVWDRFLARVQPDPAIRRWLQTLVGYSLYGKNFERIMVVLFGGTTTGKSQFMNAIDGALGDYCTYTNLSVLRDNQDERPRADVVRIFRKRIAWAEEASGAWHIHPDQIKRMAGATQLAARLPFAKEYADGEPSFTFWLLSNHPPSIEGADNAVWQRMRVVPFSVRIPDEEIDVRLPERLATTRARAAILAWAVEGWNLYAEERAADRDPLAVPNVATLRSTVEEFQSGVSNLDAFAAEALLFGQGRSDEVNRLYSAYTQWCGEEGVKADSKNAFGRFLTGRGAGSVKVGKVRVGEEWRSARIRENVELNQQWSRLAVGDT